MEIDIWSDIACPWCFIGLTRFQKALDGFEHRDEVSVRLHSYQLDPSLPDTFA
ncbi:MAG: DsbA family protein, partial [Luteococcus japonicus]